MALFDDDMDLGEALREMGISDHVEARLKEIKTFTGVKGILVLNTAFHPVKWYFEETHATLAYQYVSVVSQLLKTVRSSLQQLNKLEPDNWGDAAEQDVACLRLRSKKNEIIITPGAEYTLVVVQELNVID
ncbi:Dynein light chain roadblock-type protein [Diplonema papillatum]|nr:Dynein light chain roadblock-type protein [Diplonema papillatum]